MAYIDIPHPLNLYAVEYQPREDPDARLTEWMAAAGTDAALAIARDRRPHELIGAPVVRKVSRVFGSCDLVHYNDGRVAFWALLNCARSVFYLNARQIINRHGGNTMITFQELAGECATLIEDHGDAENELHAPPSRYMAWSNSIEYWSPCYQSLLAIQAADHAAHLDLA